MPKRFLVLLLARRQHSRELGPSGTETNFQLSRILAPLEAHKQDIVVVDGVDNVAQEMGSATISMRGMGSMLTGIELLPGTTQGGAGDPAGLRGISDRSKDRQRDRQGHQVQVARGAA